MNNKILYADGFKNNDKNGGYLVCNSNKKILDYKDNWIGSTHNEMEYKAVLSALQIADENAIIYSDSKLVVNQINGMWRVQSPHIAPYFDVALMLRKQIPNLTLEWVPRRMIVKELGH